MAVSILKAQPLIGNPAVYVFTTTGRSPISGFGKAKSAIDAEIAKMLREEAEARGDDPYKVAPFADWRVHDLRRTVATHLEDALGVPPHIVGSVLNHSPTGYKGVTAVYTRGDLIFARRRALVAWARLLQLAIEGGDAWLAVAAILRPQTEAEAARTDELRRIIQADEETWTRYRLALTAGAAVGNVTRIAG